MLITFRRQQLAGAFVEPGHRVLAGQRAGAVAMAAGENFPAQPAALVNLQQVDGDVHGPQAQKLAERILPARRGLVRQARNQVEADVLQARFTQEACSVE